MLKVYIFLFSLISCVSLFADLKIDVESEIALLINVDTNRVLYEKMSEEILFPASITKIATVLFALKEVGEDLDVMIGADQDCIGSITASMQKTMNYNHPPHWLVIGGTHMNIKKGDTFSLEELLYGMMLVSANDASNMVAKYVSGTIPQFILDLNEYLEELGCTQTRFLNPHGLHFPRHQTSAKDIALIATEALKNPIFRRIVQTQKYGSLKNSNSLIKENSAFYYPYAIGVKTGFHSEAGHNLVAAAEKNGRTLLAIVLKAPNEQAKFRDAKALFEKAYSEEKKEEVYLQKGPQPFRYKIEGIRKLLKTEINQPVTLAYFPSEKPLITGTIYWHPPALPIHKGDIVADLILKDEKGNLVKEIPLLAEHSLSIKSSYKRILSFLALLLVGGLIYKWKRSKKQLV